MAVGVFYREFTKFNQFEGQTSLSALHTHLFVLGMFFFLICTLLDKSFAITRHKRFPLFYILYNVGLAWTAVMLVVRGILQVKGESLSSGTDAMISGLAGVGHIVLGIAVILFFVLLRKSALKKTKEKTAG